MRTPQQRSVLSQSLSSLHCRTCMGDQRRFLSGLFNRYNNVMNYYPLSGNSRSCPPSWVPGPSVNTDPRGGPALPTRPPGSSVVFPRRRSVIVCGGIIVTPPDLFTVRHPGCRNGNVSLKSLFGTEALNICCNVLVYLGSPASDSAVLYHKYLESPASDSAVLY